MIQGLLNKRQFSILERAFCAEVEAALNNTIPLLRTKSKMAYELCEAGYLEDMEWVVSGYFQNGNNLTPRTPSRLNLPRIATLELTGAAKRLPVE